MTMFAKPYRNAWIISRETPYQVHENHQDAGLGDSGVFQAGRVVWVDGNPDHTPPGGRLAAYADGLGVISLDPSYLRAQF